MLRKRDAQQNKICFVDISDDNFRPEDNSNISYEQVSCACTTCLLEAVHPGLVFSSLMLRHAGHGHHSWGAARWQSHHQC